MEKAITEDGFIIGHVVRYVAEDIVKKRKVIEEQNGIPVDKRLLIPRPIFRSEVLGSTVLAVSVGLALKVMETDLN